MIKKFGFFVLIMAILFSCKKEEKVEYANPQVVDKETLEKEESSFKSPTSATTDHVLKLTTQNSDTLVVVNFFATWCMPCVKEIPVFLNAKKEFSDKKFKLSFVSIDSPDMYGEPLNNFCKEHGLLDGVYHWSNADEQELLRVYKGYQGYIPFTLIKKGNKEEWIMGGIQDELGFMEKLRNF